jgi:riboflavin synthase alpha subunit
MIDRVYGHLVWGHLAAAARLDADAARECATSVPRGEIAE